MQANGGVLPPDAVLMKGSNIAAAARGQRRARDAYWVISRASAVSGGDLRTADAGPRRERPSRCEVSP